MGEPHCPSCDSPSRPAERVPGRVCTRCGAVFRHRESAIDTEAAEVWRGLPPSLRSRLLIDESGVLTDLGKRVAAYGRTQTGGAK